MRFLGEARRVARELVIVDSSVAALAGRRGVPAACAEGRVALGGLQALLHRARASPTSSAAARRSSRATGSSSCARPLDAAALVLPLARLAPARQPGLPCVRRGRLPDRVAARGRGARGPARVHPRPGAGGRRGRRAPALARPCRADAPALARLEEDAFYATFYCASVTRCYPGRAPGGGGDRTPAAREQELCAFWREWELRLLRPALIVPVGGLAIRRLLGLASLDASIGERFSHGDAVAVPLPHPSGVSRWLNAPANQARLERAVELVHGELRHAAAALNEWCSQPPPRCSA